MARDVRSPQPGRGAGLRVVAPAACVPRHSDACRCATARAVGIRSRAVPSRRGRRPGRPDRERDRSPAEVRSRSRRRGRVHRNETSRRRLFQAAWRCDIRRTRDRATNGSRRCRWLGDSSVRDPGRAPASNSPTARDSGEEPGSGRVQCATWRWHDHLFWCARCVAVSRIGSGRLRPVLAIRAVRGCVFGPAAIERTARSWPRTGRPASACPGDASRDGTVRHTSGDRDEDRRTCRRTRSARRRPVEVVAVDRTRCVRGRMDADIGWPVHGDRRERRAAGGRRRAGSQSRRQPRWC